MKDFIGFTPNQLHGRQKAKTFIIFFTLLVIAPVLTINKIPYSQILLIVTPFALYGLFRVISGAFVFSIGPESIIWNGIQFDPSSIRSLVYKRLIFDTFTILTWKNPRAFRPLYFVTEIVTIVTDAGEFDIGKVVKKSITFEDATEPVRVEGNSFLYSEHIHGFPMRDIILLSDSEFDEAISNLTSYSNKAMIYLSGG
ncbi:hypothetical protein, partial [Leptospira haakeii]